MTTHMPPAIIETIKNKRHWLESCIDNDNADYLPSLEDFDDIMKVLQLVHDNKIQSVSIEKELFFLTHHLFEDVLPALHLEVPNHPLHDTVIQRVVTPL